MVENKENSIFILDCMSDNIDEFNNQKIVKIDTMKIEVRAKLELYHGIKYAIHIDKNIIDNHNNNLSDIMFHTIL